MVVANGFQEHQCDELIFSSSPPRDLWLVVQANIPRRVDFRPQGGLLASAQKRDEYIATHSTTSLSNGYCVHKITSLENLRDVLELVLPFNPSPNKDASSSINSHSNHFLEGLDEVKRFELFREVIQHEDDLLNQRVSWIILAQSFLMAAFITNSTDKNLRYITACVGLATVIVTMPAIVAAGQNIEVQQQVYFSGLDSDEQCQKLHGHDRDLIWRTNERSKRGLRGHAFPNTAYRGRYGVPILTTVVALALVQFSGWCFLLTALVLDW